MIPLKKFSLLALVAVMVMAFAGAAFAAATFDSLARDDDAPGNLGALGGTGNDEGAAYYLKGTTPKLDLGLKATATQDSGGTAFGDDTKLTGTVDGASVVLDPTDKIQTATPKNTKFTVSFDTMPTAAFELVVGVEGTGAPIATKTVKVTPTAVEFSATYPTDQDATQGIKVKTGSTTPIVVTLAGKAGAKVTDFTNLSVTSNDTAPVVFDDTAKAFLGTLTDGVKVEYDTSAKTVTLTPVGAFAAGLKGDLTLVGTTDAPTVNDGTTEAAAIAGINKDDVILTIHVETVDYEVKPQSATWAIGTSDDVVSLDVDMAFADFGCVSTDLAGFELLVTSKDKVGTDSYVSADYNVVVSADADNAVISLDKTLLSNMAGAILASQGTSVNINKSVNVNVVDKDGKFASMTITFTRNADPVTPANAPERAAADADNALLGVTSNDVADAATVNAYVSADVTGLALTPGPNGSTLVSTLAVVKAISDDNNIGIWGSKNGANITSLPIVSADLSTEVATLRFVKIAGSTLVSGDRTGNGVRRVSANDLNIIKLVASKDVTVLRRLGSVKDKKSADLDGKYNVYYDGKLVDTVTSASDDYELRVYIADNGKYDLAKSVNGKVVDPLAIVKSTGASHSSSSSCDMGFGLAAVAGLAALALRKRSK